MKRYASQWFLTLFTAKFPLYMVFRILDLFLCEGVLVIFSIALSLLKNSQKDLLALDFEGVLKYFRVTMPKKYRHEQLFKDLMQLWIPLHSKITEKKLAKYEKNYKLVKEAEALKEDPAIRFEKECKKLNATLRRLEQENDDLANEYIESKINLSKQLEETKDNYEFTKAELTKYKTDYQNKLNESFDTNKKLMSELDQLKKIWRKQTDKYELELERNSVIIAEYKQICNTLSGKVEKWSNFRKKYEAKAKKLNLCDTCVEVNKIDDEALKAMENNGGNSSNDLNNTMSKSYSSDSSLTSSSLSNETFDTDKLDEAINTNEPVSSNENTNFKDHHQSLSRIKHLELELARVKLELVDAQCKNQEFDHKLKGYINIAESGDKTESSHMRSTSSQSSSNENPVSMSSSSNSLNLKQSSGGGGPTTITLASLTSGNSASNNWLSKTLSQVKNQVVQKAQKVKITNTNETN